MSTFKQNWARFSRGSKTNLTIISLIFMWSLGLTIINPSVTAVLNLLLYVCLAILMYLGMVLGLQLDECHTYIRNAGIERKLGQNIVDAVKKYGSVTITRHPSAYFIEAPADKHLDE
ncbi:hypothetical protein GWO63_010155 [Corynebacterium macginleyi]|uniref:Uncharacterized protein n=1 Tax=Corynebacterium macginleyi TaxID=38290 RepID=A0ABS1Y864_9CORY|nr:hypothetical protein [Corynebacterium macginleyi]MBK4145353.1 hypothetical protein [Corynebacterium macginleyi]MBK4179760.1 hypothetical protein [Corynebacterium macginleyi]MBM0244590.1 hypothetical protein [Corynebacterium macginleyi]